MSQQQNTSSLPKVICPKRQICQIQKSCKSLGIYIFLGQMRELLFCIKHTQNPKTSPLVCYRCEKGWNIYTAACRLHRDTEHLEVSSLYPLHPTLAHTGSMRARHSAWGRQSRHQNQGFNYGCQAAPPEQVLRFPRILNHQWEPDEFRARNTRRFTSQPCVRHSLRTSSAPPRSLEGHREGMSPFWDSSSEWRG